MYNLERQYETVCQCGIKVPKRWKSLHSSPLRIRDRSQSRKVSTASEPSQVPPKPSSTYQFPVFVQPTIRSPPKDDSKRTKLQRKSVTLYALSTAVLGLGLTYAAVPLYRLFCAQTGYGGTPMTKSASAPGGQFEPTRLIAATGPRVRPITVNFNGDVSDHLEWNFKPVQRSINVVPGETALAFFTAKNNSKNDIIGIATYSIIPAQIAPYFAKVECFCFDEQKLLAGEEVDLPILFFIDRDFVEDPLMKDIKDVILSYTFFKAKRNQYGDLVPDTQS